MNIGEITNELRKLDNWTLDASTIVKDYEFKDFVESIAFVNKVKDAAEKNEHHPDIIIRYNKVKLILTTHSAKGLTWKDFALAKEIDSMG